MAITSIEDYPLLSTGTVALAADGTVYTYQPNVPGGMVPAPSPIPTEIEDYPGLATGGLGVDADGGFWVYQPNAPGGIIPPPEPIPPPVNTVAPLIQIVSGNPVPGQTAVNSNPGTWVPPQTGGYQRQWFLTQVAIPGATSNNYVIQPGDVGGTLQCGVVAIGDGGPSAQAISNSLLIVTPPEDPETEQAAQQPQARAKTLSHKHGKTHHARAVHR